MIKFIQAKKSLDYSLIIVFILIFIGIYLRFSTAFFIPNEPISDFASYFDKAIKFSNNEDFYEIFKPIGYPILLGFWFTLTTNNSLENAKLFNFLISILSIINVYLLSKQLKFTNKNTLFVIGAFSFCPQAFLYVNVIGTETVIIFLILLTLNIFFWHQINPLVRYFLLGTIVGILSIIKTFFITFSIIILIVDFYSQIKKNKTLFKFKTINYISFLMPMVLLISPLTIKNYILINEFFLLPSNSNLVLYSNNNENNIIGGFLKRELSFQPLEMINEINELNKKQFDEIKEKFNLYKIYGKYARIWIVNNPIEFIKLGFLRLYRVFFTSGILWSIRDFSELISLEGNFSTLRSLKLLENFYLSYKIFLGVFLFQFLFIHIKNIFMNRTIDLSSADVLIILSSIWLILIYFVGEGQGRYFQPFIPFAILTIPYTLRTI